MRRRGLAALVVATIGLGLVATYNTQPARADFPRISNISVGVVGGTAVYSLCLIAPSDHPPIEGAITISTAPTQGQEQRAVLTYNDLSCGFDTYFVQARFTGLAAGKYYFQEACVLLGWDAAKNPGPVIPCANRNVGLVSNFSGDRIYTDCQIDFDLSVAVGPINCHGPGVWGDLTNPVPRPTPTNTATATPTDLPINTPTTLPTSVPNAPPTATPPPASNAPTDAPTATPTGMPAATSTATAIVGAASGPGTGTPPTATPVPAVVLVTNAPPSRTRRSKPAEPALHVALLSPLVQPGGTQRIAISYSAGALVQASISFPDQGTRTLAGMTDSHGHLTLSVPVPATVPLHKGHASAPATIGAIAGPWHRVQTLAPLVHPGTTARLTLSAPATTPLRATVTLPGRPPQMVFGTTDRRGHYVLAVRVPATVGLHDGQARAQVAVWALTATRHALAAATLHISDMVVRVQVNAIKHCVQTQTVHVSYRPNAPLRILLLFSDGQHIIRATRTDRNGEAAIQAQVNLAKSSSPVRIDVQASDATAQAHRMESTTVSVALPQACQGSPPAITIS